MAATSYSRLGGNASRLRSATPGDCVIRPSFIDLRHAGDPTTSAAAERAAAAGEGVSDGHRHD